LIALRPDRIATGAKQNLPSLFKEFLENRPSLFKEFLETKTRIEYGRFGFWHSATLIKAEALPNSLSPIDAGGGAMI
jgi:hypothetical protein